MSALVDHLASRHAIHLIRESDAHDFLWRHIRDPYDLVVYQLDDRDESSYMWPYLLQYPGFVLALSYRLGRDRLLRRARRDRSRDAERASVGHEVWSEIAFAARYARLVAVPHDGVASLLASELPCAIRSVHVPVPAPPVTRIARAADAPLRVGWFDPDARQQRLMARLERRLADGGVPVHVIGSPHAEALLASSDVIVSLAWPDTGRPAGLLLAALAARLPVVIMETLTTAGWPALDPRTWTPRGSPSTPAICITIDPLDEEHSTTTALRRLATDPILADTLGRAGHDYWRAHHDIEPAVSHFERLLEEARLLPPPAEATRLPPHLDADWTIRARAILQGSAIEVDLL